MRIVVWIALGTLASSLNTRAQQTSKPAPNAGGIACFENLPTPEYPRSALRAHVDGSVWTWTHVNTQGGIDKIDTQVVSAWSEGGKLLTPAVEKAIRAAKIKSDCDGKTVSLVVRYELHGDPAPEPKVTSRTEAPNIIWIEGQPATAPESARRVRH